MRLDLGYRHYRPDRLHEPDEVQPGKRWRGDAVVERDVSIIGARHGTIEKREADLVAGAVDHNINLLSAAIGEQDAVGAESGHMGRDPAIRLALGEAIHAVASASAGVDPGMLAKREAEVAVLVADGLSNKQIGARLFISERTVDSHVRSILNKLGFSSRAQIAGWIAASNR